MRFWASEVAAAVRGRLVGPDVEFDGAAFDSRALRAGELFVPLVADRDGHDFVDDALRAGAPGYLTSRRAGAPPGGIAAIEVGDTAAALLDLAAWARLRLTDRVVGITGSVGKTSTKDLAAGAVGAGFVVAANERSFNNEQGLPVTVLAAADHTEVLVLEMGMRGFGEIARLCEVGRPTIGVVTAVGESHTERVGGIEGVAVAKRELVESLPAHGTAILNADDHRVIEMRHHTEATVVTFGAGADADVRISQVSLDEHARATFHVDSPWGAARVSLTVSGAHMASNAAAALAVAGVLGVPVDDAAAALAVTSVSAMRMEAVRTPSGGIVINDAYNANPTSMMAALDSLATMGASRAVAVLGVMAELDDPVEAHRRVADHARRRRIEVMAVGTDLYGIAPVDDPASLLAPVGPGTVVLVKASRIAGLDRIATELSA